ncbi:PREDICTED: odorant receptor 46a, isoform A-like [Papilio xuthus]|uniref:Odorant receptor n=1 Tax=Papilio xuthus TaxID=66420 RepID=A0AAJ7EFS2_PAPXU|nr:PREDICTED: odorant receptor 46a, isoform A-like [Papilio xuthus]
MYTFSNFIWAIRLWKEKKQRKVIGLYKQIDCFNINMIFWKVLGIYPYRKIKFIYNLYCKIFLLLFIIFYDVLLTVNFYFLPSQLDAFIEEMIFYFTEISVTSKVLTFLILRKNIRKILEVLESSIFEPVSDNGIKILNDAKKFNIVYWKIVAVVSFTSNLSHIISFFITHVVLEKSAEFPICSYNFLPMEIKERFIYPLYLYQSIGIHFHMLANLNIDTFFLGLMILVIAQLDILKDKLSCLTDTSKNISGERNFDREQYEKNVIINFNQAIVHHDELCKFCSLIQDTFNITLLLQFGMASSIICVCLFRFTLPAAKEYYIFLATYMFIMVIQIMVPCWFGTRIMEKSCLLSRAVYSCNWTSRSRRFKSSLRLFVERTNRPISITGGKMFTLSLVTFSSIMNSAYSFFTLLRNVQARENQ